MERRVRAENKRRGLRHLRRWGGNMKPRDVKFQGVPKGRGTNESGGVEVKCRWGRPASCLRGAGLALAWKYESKMLFSPEIPLIGLIFRGPFHFGVRGFFSGKGGEK
jgi:hypothetical protein